MNMVYIHLIHRNIMLYSRKLMAVTITRLERTIAILRSDLVELKKDQQYGMVYALTLNCAVRFFI